MTTDQPSPSVEDARAEAERRWPQWEEDEYHAAHVSGWLAHAEWAASRAVPSDQDADRIQHLLVTILSGFEGESIQQKIAALHRRFVLAARPPAWKSERTPAVPSDHTATTEDAAPIIVRAATVITANTDEPMWSAIVIAKEMASRGLLATARPDTTIEWGYRDGSGYHRADTEKQARDVTEGFDLPLVRREVSAWMEAGQ